MSSEAAWEVGLPHQSRPERSAAHIPMAEPRGFTRRFDNYAEISGHGMPEHDRDQGDDFI
ncbi:MAG: hypothetical protein ACJ8BW_39230 [Ktedonobacteraceae bacterium]